MFVKKLWMIYVLIFGIGVVPQSFAAWLRCYKSTVDNFVATPLEKPLNLMNSPCVNKNLPTVVYTFGYRGRSVGPATKAVLTAYLEKKKRNVLLLDWEEEARSGVFGISLGYVLFAVPNAKRVGQQLGDSMAILARAGLNLTHIHLVGHSLGAHVMGYAGRRARENGYVVPRITGLDPARALFEGTLSVQNGLDRTCARFVDIVHSDPGDYGTSKPSGTVDIWPNYVGEAATQPGCPTGNFEIFTRDDLCSHDRSWQYFVEAIGAPTSIVAVGAANYQGWLARSNRKSPTIFLGDLTSLRASGNFYLTTNGNAPFSRASDGLYPDANQTRRRRRNSTLNRLLKYFR